MRRLSRIPCTLALLLSVLLLAGCRPAPVQQQESYVFGTRVEVLVVDPDPARGRAAAAAVLREFDRMHRAYHAWQPSELTALNEAVAAGRPAAVSDELAGLIREAQALSAKGGHLFDPGIGRLIALWGFQADEFKAQLPADADVDAWLKARPSIADLRLEDNTATSRNRQVALDFGGYLKGWALDRAAAILRSQGVTNALINIGGNVMALGDKGGRPWRVGIQHPRRPGPLATLELADGEAVGTSGDYQRFFELDGKRYPHLLDPRSGRPAAHTQAVTVVVPAGGAGGISAGTLSDAGSKPVFIAGQAGWRDAARRLGLELIMRVDDQGKIAVTEALARRLEFSGERPAMEIQP